MILAAICTSGYLLVAGVAPNSDAHKLLGDVVFLGNSALTIGFAFRAAAARRLDARARKSWSFLAWGFFCALLGELGFADAPVAPAAPLLALVAATGYTLAYPLLFAGCMLFPSERPRASSPGIFWLDGVIVMLAGAMVVWYFIVYPAMIAAGGLTTELAFALAFPTADLVLLFGAIRLALSQPPPYSRVAARLLLLCITLLVVPDFIVIAQVFSGGPGDKTWFDSVLAIGILAGALSAYCQRAAAERSPAAATPIRADAGHPLTPMLPYAGIVLGYGLLVFSMIGKLGTAAGHALVGALLLTSLVVARQVISIKATERARTEAEEANAALVQAKATLERQAGTLQQQMIELEALRDRLHELSLRDGLTGLYNRRHLAEVLPQLFSHATRYGRPLAVLMFDIDNFKQINDRFSHGVGDQVLQTIAGLLRDRTRSSDVVARMGGEEFVVIFPETPLMGAGVYAEQLRASIAGYDWARLHSDLRVTISGGVAALGAHPSPEALLHEADEGLYLAKSSGKNRILGALTATAGRVGPEGASRA